MSPITPLRTPLGEILEPHHIQVRWDGVGWCGQGARFLDYLEDAGGLRHPTRIDIEIMTGCSIVRAEIPDTMVPAHLRHLSMDHIERLAWIRSTLGGIPGDTIEAQVPSTVPVRLKPTLGAVIIATCWRAQGT